MLNTTTTNSNNKCLKCHSTCSDKCSNCRCMDDTMYNFIDEIIGCRDCSYIIDNC